MITFDITFDASPNAIGGYLEYRYIQSNGVPSPWQVNLNLGTTQGYFPITTPTVTFTNIIGTLPDWQFNTTYQFRIKQVCGLDDSVQFSPTDGDYYVPLCPSYATSIGDFNPGTSSYPIYMTIPAPSPLTVGQSVTNFIFYIYDATNPLVPLTSVAVPTSSISPITPYVWVWDDNNVPGGIQMNTSYLVSVSYTITLSSTSEILDCEPQGITPPLCSTYYIEAGDSWALEWTDCSGVPHVCYSTAPYNGVPGWLACRSNFLLCSITFPIGYQCQNGQLVPGFVTRTNANCPTGTQVLNGAQVKIVGPGCSGNDFTDEITWSPDYGSLVVPCQQCI